MDGWSNTLCNIYSSDDVIDKILEMEDEVQSAEVTSMNVL